MLQIKNIKLAVVLVHSEAFIVHALFILTVVVPIGMVNIIERWVPVWANARLMLPKPVMYVTRPTTTAGMPPERNKSCRYNELPASDIYVAITSIPALNEKPGTHSAAGDEAPVSLIVTQQQATGS
jgi:hypothetical protein